VRLAPPIFSRRSAPNPEVARLIWRLGRAAGADSAPYPYTRARLGPGSLTDPVRTSATDWDQSARPTSGSQRVESTGFSCGTSYR